MQVSKWYFLLYILYYIFSFFGSCSSQLPMPQHEFFYCTTGKPNSQFKKLIININDLCKQIKWEVTALKAHCCVTLQAVENFSALLSQAYFKEFRIMREMDNSNLAK